MFEGRKAKSLEIQNLGKLQSDRKDKAAHSLCGGEIFVGKQNKNGLMCHWCPKCKIILYEVH